MTRKSVKSGSRGTMQKIFTRYMLIVAVFIFWIGAISVRLVHLQVNQHEELRTQAQKKRQYIHKTKELRGTIYDRSERALAMSIKANSLFANPQEIEDIDETSKKIAQILKVESSSVADIIKRGKESDKQFVWIARKLDENVYEKINETLLDEESGKHSLPKYKGLYWRREQKRKYPYATLAANVIGFTNSADQGQAGVELSKEKYLRGDIVKTWRKRDRLGRVYRESEVESEEPLDVVLTISNSIQYKTEEALARGAQRSNAQTGKAIVLDPKTGEILAMANYPSFDPNHVRKLEPGAWKNRVIEDRYAPGSVFKLVTYGSALEENLITPSEKIDCGNGTITVSKHTFTDSHAIGKVSYTKAFAQSSNVCAIKLGTKVGKETFYEYAKKFGFGKKTGISLPAESDGIIRSPDKWYGDSLASMSIGYEIGVTALQTAAAFATIANDGIKIQPHIIKEIRQADGNVVETIEPEKVRVVSKRTAKNLREMMREVVLEGTAKRAQLSGYTSAGKTGTAWKFDPKLKKVNSSKYVSSFIGFAPADNPRVVIAVVMDEPKGGARSGGAVSGPVFREIAEQILPELGVTPDATVPETFVARNETSVEDPPVSQKTQALKNENVEEIKEPKKAPAKAPEKKKTEQKAVKPRKISESEQPNKKERKKAAAPERKNTRIGKSGKKPKT